MIIPSRWFVGGKGLDDFRDEMTHDNRLRILHDFLDAGDCFPGVEIKGGVCYFLWDRDYQGDCNVITHKKSEMFSSIRPLLEQDSDVFIRFNQAISIFRKVHNSNFKSIISIVSSRRPFGLNSTFTDYHSFPKIKSDVLIYANKKTGYVKQSEIIQNIDWVNKYKVFITRAYGAGEDFPHQILNTPIFGGPNTCCTETYIVIGPFIDSTETQNVISYIKTRFFRFLVLLRKNTQDAPARVYQFVPMQDFSHPWTDEMLYKKYNLTDEEIAFIESMIRPME